MPSKVKPIPEGYRTLTPHLIVKGLPKAVEFYKKAFGAVAKEVCDGPDGKPMHAELLIGDSMMMVGEECPEYGALSPLATKSSSVSIHLYVADIDAAFAKALKAGATQTMPVADMFWGDRFGKLKDPFGHEWSMATHIANPTKEEMMKAMEEQFAAAAK